MAYGSFIEEGCGLPRAKVKPLMCYSWQRSANTNGTFAPVVGLLYDKD